MDEKMDFDPFGCTFDDEKLTIESVLESDASEGSSGIVGDFLGPYGDGDLESFDYGDIDSPLDLLKDDDGCMLKPVSQDENSSIYDMQPSPSQDSGFVDSPLSLPSPFSGVSSSSRSFDSTPPLSPSSDSQASIFVTVGEQKYYVSGLSENRYVLTGDDGSFVIAPYASTSSQLTQSIGKDAATANKKLPKLQPKVEGHPSSANLPIKSEDAKDILCISPTGPTNAGGSCLQSAINGLVCQSNCASTKTHLSMPNPIAYPSIPSGGTGTVEPSCKKQEAPKRRGRIAREIRDSILTSEDRALKYQLKLIKNRESALLSRKKRKEYLTSLEVKVGKLSSENEALRNENAVLQERICLLEQEKKLLLSSGGSLIGNSKKGVTLFAFCILFLFNVGPLLGLLGRPMRGEMFLNTPVASPSAEVHHGRSLLWTNESQDNSWMNESDQEYYGRNLTKPGDLPTCPMSINKSESLRLDNELRGWVFGLDSAKRPSSSAHRKFHPKLHPKQVIGYPLAPLLTSQGLLVDDPLFSKDIPSSKFSYREINLGSQDHNTGLHKDLQVFDIRKQFSLSGFLDAIHRKDDTFYVVSFSGDHVLLPAIAHNATHRPKMSLILPAIPLNSSMQPPPNHVAMMQIDCEVVNTKLMHLENWLVPEKKQSSSQEPLKQHGNSTKPKENVDNPQNSQGFLSPDARERLREIRKKSKGKETAKKSSSHS